MTTASQLFLEFIKEFFIEILASGVIFIIITIIYFARDRIRKWYFLRKIKPIYKRMMSNYEKILPGYIELKPRLKAILKEKDLPKECPFGYIFVPSGREELIYRILLTYIPISSSLKRIRLLFDEPLRKCLFDYLSYRLSLELGMEDIAVKFRDAAMRDHPEDYKVIERLYEDGKLTGILLNEAIVRLKKARGKISISDVEEFSTLARKLAEIDVKLIRIGPESDQYYIERILKEKQGVVLLARGKNIEKAIKVATQLCERDFEFFSQDELGFSNPEIGSWIFLYPKERTVPLMRIWLKRTK